MGEWTINWDDGNTDTVSGDDPTSVITHNYTQEKSYTISVSATDYVGDSQNVAGISVGIGRTGTQPHYENVSGASASYSEDFTEATVTWSYTWPSAARTQGRNFTIDGGYQSWDYDRKYEFIDNNVNEDVRSIVLSTGSRFPPEPASPNRVSVTAHWQELNPATDAQPGVNATAFATGSDSAEVAWSESRTDLVGSVMIQQSSSDDGGTTWSDWEELDTVGSTACTYAVTGLAAGVQYRYKVIEVPDDSNQTAHSAETYAIQTACVLSIDVSAETTDLTMTYDADGIADYEDGLVAASEAGFGADDVTDTSNWVPITITISGANSANAALNREALLNARLTFSYDAEDIQSSYADDYVPSGRLRLWKTNSAARTAADFIEADTEYSLYDLCGDASATTLTLWVENFSVFEDAGVTIALTPNSTQSSNTNRLCHSGPAESEDTTNAALEFHTRDYTTSALRHWIETDPGYGTKVKFLLDQMDEANKVFYVGEIFDHFQGDTGGACASSAATTLAQAKEWAIDALRVFAGYGLGHKAADSYFYKMAFAFAGSGDGHDTITVSIGQTLDWLYLFSGETSNASTSAMYPFLSRMIGRPDLFNVFCYSYSGVRGAMGRWLGEAFKLSNPNVVGLNDMYKDSHVPTSDQAHHFAGFFEIGAHYGNGVKVLRYALGPSGSEDYVPGDDDDAPAVMDWGDFRLGIMAADLGRYYSNNPKYFGDWVTQQLTNGGLPSTERQAEIIGA